MQLILERIGNHRLSVLSDMDRHAKEQGLTNLDNISEYFLVGTRHSNPSHTREIVNSSTHLGVVTNADPFKDDVIHIWHPTERRFIKGDEHTVRINDKGQSYLDHNVLHERGIPSLPLSKIDTDNHDLSEASFGWQDEHRAFNKPLISHLELYTSASAMINKHMFVKHGIMKEGAYPVPDYYKNIADHMERHIQDASTTLPRDMNFYSGTGHNYKPADHLEYDGNSRILRTTPFISSSLNPKKAAGFTAPDSHIIHFKLPAGFNRGTYVGNMSKCSSEYEYILHPHQKWRYTGSKVMRVIHKVPYGMPINNYNNNYADPDFQSSAHHNVTLHTVEPY